MWKILAPVLILVLLIGGGFLILNNPPEVQRGGPPGGSQTVVEVMTITSQPFQIDVATYGTVSPRTQSALVAQVSGQIMSVADNFRAGGFFKQGDTLVTIDPRDYEADVQIAQASLMDALQAQAEEEARSEQAAQDWARLGDPNEAPSDLVLRKPQLMAAQARVASARSNLVKAELDLERTRITAPFDGRVLSQQVDIGQVVNVGLTVAEIYSTDLVEVRLPIKNADLGYVDLPETADDEQPLVTFASELGDEVSWTGRVVRTEGAIDQASRQLHVVAQIDAPFDTSNGTRPLKIGEYLTASITGRQIQHALVLPNETIYQNSYVYVVEEGVLRRQEIEIDWQDRAVSIVSRGLSPGELLVTTPLGQVTSGTRVSVAGHNQSTSNRGERRTATNTGAGAPASASPIADGIAR